MVDILHRVGVVAPLDEVYRAVVPVEPQGVRRDRPGTARPGRRQDQRLALISGGI